MKDIFENQIIDTDSYKSSQPEQYPEDTAYIVSHLTPRYGVYNDIVSFGFQWLSRELMKPITVEMVQEAAEFAKRHGEPFPYDGWMHIAQNLKGKLPLKISAVPEGSVTPVGMPTMIVENTDPKVPWIVSWMETRIMRLWYPTTVASRSFHAKNLILGYLEKSSDNPQAEINFKLHDFGSRGCTCKEQAAIGGAAHLTSFMGSDTQIGVWLANNVYNCEMSGFSIPASEHSTITSWGRENEKEACLNMVKKFGTKGNIVACVSDSYNIYKCVEDIWCSEEAQNLIKETGCKLVIRPDSGDPAVVAIRVLDILKHKLGMEKNSKGYLVLPPHMGMIYGDGITDSTIQDILANVLKNGYSASNLAFGMGAGLLQKLDRDTEGFALKCCARQDTAGMWHDVYKDPIEGSDKKSFKGRPRLITDGNHGYQVIKFEDNIPNGWYNTMTTVYKDGELLVTTDFNNIRTQIEHARTVIRSKTNTWI